MADFIERFTEGLNIASGGLLASAAESAVSAYRRTLIEECCAGAVVLSLQEHVPGDSLRWRDCEQRGWPIPIAATTPSLAEDVARELASRCWCDGVWSDGDCHDLQLPPFAAAYFDAGEVRMYVLVSGECEVCMAGNVLTTDGRDAGVCGECSGTGSRTDVGKICERYGGSGDARKGSFTVRL